MHCQSAPKCTTHGITQRLLCSIVTSCIYCMVCSIDIRDLLQTPQPTSRNTTMYSMQTSCSYSTVILIINQLLHILSSIYFAYISAPKPYVYQYCRSTFILVRYSGQSLTFNRTELWIDNGVFVICHFFHLLPPASVRAHETTLERLL